MPDMPDAKKLMLAAIPDFLTPGNAARFTFNGLRKQIAAFEQELAQDEETCAWLTHFGHDVKVVVEALDYENPDIIIFRGSTSDGHRVTLLQHASQVNVLLVATKTTPGNEPKRVGFRLEK